MINDLLWLLHTFECAYGHILQQLQYVHDHWSLWLLYIYECAYALMIASYWWMCVHTAQQLRQDPAQWLMNVHMYSRLLHTYDCAYVHTPQHLQQDPARWFLMIASWVWMYIHTQTAIITTRSMVPELLQPAHPSEFTLQHTLQQTLRHTLQHTLQRAHHTCYILQQAHHVCSTVRFAVAYIQHHTCYILQHAHHVYYTVPAIRTSDLRWGAGVETQKGSIWGMGSSTI